MRRSSIAVVVSSTVIAGLAIVLMLWPSRRDEAPPLDPGPVVRDAPRAEPAPPPRDSLSSPSSDPAGPTAAAAPSPAVASAAREHPPLPAAEVLGTYRTDACACYSTACTADLADRYTTRLLSMRDFDPGEAEQQALIEGIKTCIEVVRARAQPEDSRMPAELVAQRDDERQKIMLRERGGP